MNNPWFITGTDTEIGKTWCTLALMQYFKKQGLCVAGMKPIATGCHTAGTTGLRNEDATRILNCSGLDVPYDIVNPYAFIPPIAPHLAAAQIKQTIRLDKIINAYNRLATQAEVVIIEGVGGWRVLLNDTQSLKDIVLAIDAKVILVVGLRLGCINHALLSAETIIRDGCCFAGWIANTIDPHFAAQDSIDTLVKHLKAPLLAHIPFSSHQDILHNSDQYFKF